MQKIGLGLACLGAILALGGCNPDDKQHLAEDTKRLAATTGEALTNARLAGNVHFVLSVWKGIEKGSLDVQAKDGVITLVGEVKNQEMKQRILNVTKQIEGVEKVVDKLTLPK